MQIIKIDLYEDSMGHDNLICGDNAKVPEGWAVIPEEMLPLENFPFGDIEVAEIDGVMTVTSWAPGVIPEPDPIPEPEPTTTDLMDVLLGVSV